MNDWEKLKASYPDEKRAWDATYPWIFRVARPASFPISLACRRLGVSANAVTVFTAVLGALSFPCLASGSAPLMTAGGACLLLYTIFDCVDGNLARAWPETGSPAGQWWGELVGNFYTLSYPALGLGLGGEWALYGAFTAIAKQLVSLIRNNFWQTLGGLWKESKNRGGYEPHTGRWYYKVYYNLTDPQAHIAALPFLVFYGLGHHFLAASLAISLADLAFILFFYLRRASSIGGERGKTI